MKIETSHPIFSHSKYEWPILDLSNLVEYFVLKACAMDSWYLVKPNGGVVEDVDISMNMPFTRFLFVPQFQLPFAEIFQSAIFFDFSWTFIVAFLDLVCFSLQK